MIKCKYCEKEFFISVKHKTQIFCSGSCGANYRFKILKISNRPKNGKNLECINCKKEIYVRPSNGDKKFCSKECHNQFRVGKPKKNRTGKIIPCLFCQKEFYRCKTLIQEKNFCSPKCQYGYMKTDKGWGFIKIYEKAKNNPYKRISIKGKWFKEHRLIMENHLGRKLEKDEVVHHINGDQHDNKIENLMLVDPSEHGKIEFSIRKRFK